MRRESPELALADEHVAQATQHVARQKELIGKLERGGHPTALALELLSSFEEALASHTQHRNRLLAEGR